MLIKRILTLSIILLFIGVGIQPAIATVQTQEKIFGNLKKYYLKRFSDFSTNSEIKSFSKRYNALGIIELINSSYKENLMGVNNTLKFLLTLILLIITLPLLIFLSMFEVLILVFGLILIIIDGFTPP